MPFEFLFGRRKTPQELLRQNQRALNKAMRELDRERMRLETQEKKVIADIKKMAKLGQMVGNYYRELVKFYFTSSKFLPCIHFCFNSFEFPGRPSRNFLWFSPNFPWLYQDFPTTFPNFFMNLFTFWLQDAVKIMAKDLVRTRRYVKKFIMMRANIQAVSLKVMTLKSQDAMAQAMKGVTRAMQSMNKQLNLPQIQKIMMEFERQTEIMDMKEEMMSDAIDDAIGDDDDEMET
jgi:hypothetical protein